MIAVSSPSAHDDRVGAVTIEMGAIAAATRFGAYSAFPIHLRTVLRSARKFHRNWDLALNAERKAKAAIQVVVVLVAGESARMHFAGEQELTKVFSSVLVRKRRRVFFQCLRMVIVGERGEAVIEGGVDPSRTRMVGVILVMGRIEIGTHFVCANSLRIDGTACAGSWEPSRNGFVHVRTQRFELLWIF